MTDQLLEEIYYNPQNPASYGGVQALSKESGVSVKKRGKMAKKLVSIYTPQTGEETIFDKTLSRERNRSAMASGSSRYATLSSPK